MLSQSSRFVIAPPNAARPQADPTPLSATTPATMPRSRPMAAGSTSRSAVVPGSTSSWLPGPRASTTRNAPAACSICSSSPSCSTPAPGPSGSTAVRSLARSTGAARAWLSPAWKCSRLACSAATLPSPARWTLLASRSLTSNPWPVACKLRMTTSSTASRAALTCSCG